MNGPSCTKKSIPVAGVLSTSRTEPSSGLMMKASCSPRRTCAPANFTRRSRPALVAETDTMSSLVMTEAAWPGVVSLRMMPRLLRKRMMARSVCSAAFSSISLVLPA